MTNYYSRRKFVTQCLQSSTILLGVGLVSGACNKKVSVEESNNSITSCDDVSGVAEAELQKRKQFAYVNKTTDALKQCHGCKLYLPPKADEKCGGCMLFQGPVDASGSCTYWAPLD